MTTRRKKGTTSRMKTTSRRVQNATLGNHVHTQAGSSRRLHDQNVDFSSQRKSRRATRGYIDTITPDTSSGEDEYEHLRRTRSRAFSEEIQHRMRVRRTVIIIVGCIAVLAIAIGVGVAVFFGSLNGKLALEDSDAESALVAVEDDEPFYTLIAADLDQGDLPELGAGPDALMLVRIDPATRYVAVVSIPANTRVELSDGEMHELRDAANQGDAALINSVASLLQVDISHYVKTDADGIESLISDFNDIEIDVKEEVDDPTAGSEYLPSGTWVLSGSQVLTLLRASNFAGGIATQAENQREVATAVSLRLLEGSSFDFLFTLDSVGGTFRTDASQVGASSLADAMRGIDAGSIHGVLLPGSQVVEQTDVADATDAADTADETDTADTPDATDEFKGEETEVEQTTYYVISESSWSDMLAAIEAEQDLTVQAQASEIAPDSFTITVLNGSGVTGGAAQLAETLENLGFKVTETGNTESYVYTETLVIYHDESGEPEAQTVIDALGAGRGVNGGDYYSFDTDILVILGDDWKPIT